MIWGFEEDHMEDNAHRDFWEQMLEDEKKE